MSENTDIIEQMSKIKTWGHIRLLNVSYKNKKGFYCRQLFLQNSIKGFPVPTRSLRWEPPLMLPAAATGNPYSYSHLLASSLAPASATWPRGLPQATQPLLQCHSHPAALLGGRRQDRGRSTEQDPEERKVAEPQEGPMLGKRAGCRLQAAARYRALPHQEYTMLLLSSSLNWVGPTDNSNVRCSTWHFPNTFLMSGLIQGLKGLLFFWVPDIELCLMCGGGPFSSALSSLPASQFHWWGSSPMVVFCSDFYVWSVLSHIPCDICLCNWCYSGAWARYCLWMGSQPPL